MSDDPVFTEIDEHGVPQDTDDATQQWLDMHKDAPKLQAVNPYDETVPVGERLGTQSLYGDQDPDRWPDPVPIIAKHPDRVPWWKRLKNHRPEGKKARLARLERERIAAVGAQPEPAKPPARPKPSLATGVVPSVLEVVGMTVLSVGCGIIWLTPIWLGVIVAGLCLVVLGVAAGR